MPDAVPSSIGKIDARLAGLTPGTLRHQINTALRQFRASWLDLGRLLNEVAYGGDYKDWGYDDMEVFCARELGLKKPTVQKLMISYNYMRKYEARLLRDREDGKDDSGAVPDYQTVALLDSVRRSEVIEPEEADELHRRAFVDAAADDETALRKELRERLKPPSAAENIQTGRRQELARILAAARALRRLLSGTAFIPEALRERLEQSLTELEGLD